MEIHQCKECGVEYLGDGSEVVCDECYEDMTYSRIIVTQGRIINGQIIPPKG